MKTKLIIYFTIALLLCGCTVKESEEILDSTTPEESSEISIEEPEIDSELNHDEIMAGDFSSIAGEYVNSEGLIFILDEDGLTEDERQTGEIYCIPKNIYFMGIHQKTDLDGGYSLVIFPEGVEVPTLEGLTDLTKIRICHGQDYPLRVEEIYTKK